MFSPKSSTKAAKPTFEIFDETGIQYDYKGKSPAPRTPGLPTRRFSAITTQFNWNSSEENNIIDLDDENRVITKAIFTTLPFSEKFGTTYKSFVPLQADTIDDNRLLKKYDIKDFRRDVPYGVLRRPTQSELDVELAKRGENVAKENLNSEQNFKLPEAPPPVRLRRGKQPIGFFGVAGRTRGIQEEDEEVGQEDKEVIFDVTMEPKNGGRQSWRKFILGIFMVIKYYIWEKTYRNFRGHARDMNDVLTELKYWCWFCTMFTFAIGIHAMFGFFVVKAASTCDQLHNELLSQGKPGLEGFPNTTTPESDPFS